MMLKSQLVQEIAAKENLLGDVKNRLEPFVREEHALADLKALRAQSIAASLSIQPD